MSYNFSVICHHKTLSVVTSMGVSILYTVVYNWGAFIKKSVRRTCCFEVFSSYDFYIKLVMFLLKGLKLRKLPRIFFHFAASVLISSHVIH
jgi:hypothetical protein